MDSNDEGSDPFQPASSKHQTLSKEAPYAPVDGLVVHSEEEKGGRFPLVPEAEFEVTSKQSAAEKAVPILVSDIANFVDSMPSVAADMLDWKLFEAALTSTDEEETGTDPESESSGEPYVPAGVGKLRALARVVMINLRWAKDIRRGDEHKGFEATHHDKVTGHRRSSYFKVADFLAAKRIISGLTEEEKDALQLHPIGRKPEDIRKILKLMERYKCFDKFASTVREDLAMWARYDSFDDSRVL